MARTARLGPLDVALAVAAAVDIVLLGAAIHLGRGEVADGAGRVTNGYTVALSIAAALAVALLVQRLRVSDRLRRRTQLAVAVAIAAHAIGHLARLYHRAWWYDDLLHMALPLAASVLCVRFAQEMRLFPKRHATRVRAALLAALFAIAIAGLWEIFEFTADRLFRTREQDDLADTMQDMIDGLVGGFFAAAWCWRFPRERAGRSQVAETSRGR